MFRVVIVPRYSIEIEKGEKLIPILVKSFPVLDHYFTLRLRICYLKEKLLNRFLVLSKETALQTKSINRLTMACISAENSLTILDNSSLKGCLRKSSLRSRIRCMRHFCCGQVIESYAL